MSQLYPKNRLCVHSLRVHNELSIQVNSMRLCRPELQTLLSCSVSTGSFFITDELRNIRATRKKGQRSTRMQSKITDLPLQHQARNTLLNVNVCIISTPMNLHSVIKELPACLTLLVSVWVLLRLKDWLYRFVPAPEYQALYLVIIQMLTLSTYNYQALHCFRNLYIISYLIFTTAYKIWMKTLYPTYRKSTKRIRVG